MPLRQHSGIVVEQHDRLEIDGTLYAVTSPRLFNYEHAFTGRDFGYYWVAVQGASG
jgi:hypothetical protein